MDLSLYKPRKIIDIIRMHPDLVMISWSLIWCFVHFRSFP